MPNYKKIKTTNSKAKLFIENFFVYGLGGVISKLVPIIMLPIVTRLMPGTEYFGISDLSNTAASFGSAVAVLGMYDAMYRMFFERDDINYKKNICSTAFLFTAFQSVVVSALMCLGQKIIAKYFFWKYKIFLFGLYNSTYYFSFGN